MTHHVAEGRRRRRARTAVVAAAGVTAGLALAAPASAGCFATVGIDSTPAGMTAGSTWTVDLAVRQHGERLVTDATPTVVLTAADGSVRRIDGVPAAAPGHFTATVPLPAAGTFALAVEDGFERPYCSTLHPFGSVTVADGGTAGSAQALGGGGGGDGGAVAAAGVDDAAAVAAADPVAEAGSAQATTPGGAGDGSAAIVAGVAGVAAVAGLAGAVLLVRTRRRRDDQPAPPLPPGPTTA